MMKRIEKQRGPVRIGKETAKFLIHKYLNLVYLLIPSIAVSFWGKILSGELSFTDAAHKLPLMLFEIIPMFSLGYRGYYIIGISWYISAMLFALAVLFPLCRKYGSGFILAFGPPAVLLSYGFLSKVFGSMAVESWLSDPYYIPTGLLRGIAGCLAGCILYEAVTFLKKKRFGIAIRMAALVFEALGLAYMFYACKYHAKSAYDFVLIFLIFALLLVGIGDVAGVKKYYSSNKTKIFGTVSTLLVLNHYQWKLILMSKAKESGMTSYPIHYYFILIACSCCLSYCLSLLLKLLVKKARKCALQQ